MVSKSDISKNIVGYIWNIIEHNDQLRKEAYANYENNPNNLHPSPRNREIIEKYAHPTNQEKYLDIAKRWELGQVSFLDEEAGSVIGFLMDWYSCLSWPYIVGYCYGRMDAMKNQYDKLVAANIDKPFCILASIHPFKENYIQEIIENWEAISQAFSLHLKENKKQA